MTVSERSNQTLQRQLSFQMECRYKYIKYKHFKFKCEIIEIYLNTKRQTEYEILFNFNKLCIM